MSAARDLIRELEAGGLTQREIARRINRGPSYVSKVATGRKPGGGLEASLRALRRGAGSAHAPRRRTATGRPAAVRTPARAPETASSRPRGVRGGMNPDGLSGTSPVAWRVRAWRGSGGWQDLDRGGDKWTNERGVEYVVLGIRNLDGDGKESFRQFAVFFTDDYDLADLVEDVMNQYGVAE